MNKLQKLSKEYEKDFELIPIYNRLIDTNDWKTYWNFVQKNLTYEQYKHYIKCYDNGIDIKYIMNKNQEKNFKNIFSDKEFDDLVNFWLDN